MTNNFIYEGKHIQVSINDTNYFSINNRNSGELVTFTEARHAIEYLAVICESMCNYIAVVETLEPPAPLKTENDFENELKVNQLNFENERLKNIIIELLDREFMQ